MKQALYRLLIFRRINCFTQRVTVDPVTRLGFFIAEYHLIAYSDRHLAIFGLITVFFTINNQKIAIEIRHTQPFLEGAFPLK